MPTKINPTKLKPCSVDTFTRTTSTQSSPTNALANITSHFADGGNIIFGDIAKNYVTIERLFLKGGTSVAKFGPNKGQLVTTPDR